MLRDGRPWYSVVNVSRITKECAGRPQRQRARPTNESGPRSSVAEATFFFGSLRVSVIRPLCTPGDGPDFAKLSKGVAFCSRRVPQGAYNLPRGSDDRRKSAVDADSHARNVTCPW